MSLNNKLLENIKNNDGLKRPCINFVNEQEVNSLFKNYKKPYYYPSLKESLTNINQLHQIDILETTNDNGYKYILSVIDVYNSIIDARPLQTKTMIDCIDALKDMYNNNRYGLNYPNVLHCDNAFDNKYFKAFCEKHNIYLRISLPYNHTQQSYIERTNQLIGQFISKIQLDREITTKKTNKEFVNDLPFIIEVINSKRPILPSRNDNELLLNNDFIYKTGSVVRVKEWIPRDYITQKALRPPFRDSDIKWSKDPHLIIDVKFIPKQPPLYQVKNLSTNKIVNSLFTNNQLQLIKIKE